ncbi:hypothetical protein T459_35191 [Capsicum annuum]|uniref:Amidase domain-containing protein n=1 Tax=Capsicum annuum TaxID=4072 RepID=A0A2G2XU50_CAPAN|nr:hypothetical protein T459_35191 [Capsicum annuum]
MSSKLWHFPSTYISVLSYQILELGQLLKANLITSVELTGIFLKRIKRLKSAGAVLVAKLVTGSLAYDDIWFGGRITNPWNIEEHSVGSSARPAFYTSAGLVPFSIGSETSGSITYPASRCGVMTLRPPFGAVSRSGVMSIDESLDKLGPFCRNSVDCVIVLDAIREKDPDDVSSRDIPFTDPSSVNRRCRYLF